MTSEHTLTTLTTEIVERLHITHQRLPQTLTNLDNAMPGYPASCPGAAPSHNPTPNPDLDPDGNPLPPVKLTTVEQLASHRDPARTAHNRIKQLLQTTLLNTINELYSLTQEWGYTPARPATTTDTNHEWCTSCLRIDQCSDRHRGDLCRWCYDFHAIQHRQPSTDLLDKHHRGIRITQAMVTADKPATRHPKRKKRAT